MKVPLLTHSKGNHDASALFSTCAYGHQTEYTRDWRATAEVAPAPLSKLLQRGLVFQAVQRQKLASGPSFPQRKREDSLKDSAIILQDNNTIIKTTLHSPFSFQSLEDYNRQNNNYEDPFLLPREERHNWQRLESSEPGSRGEDEMLLRI